MPDITMCRDQECPERSKCYRFTAVPDDRWQSYFCQSPRKDKGCPYFVADDRATPKEDK